MTSHWTPSEEAKGQYWDAVYKLLLYFQEKKQPVLDMPQTEEGLTLLGDYYDAVEVMLFPVWPVAAQPGAQNVVLTFAIITSAHLKELEQNPGSKVSLHELSMNQKNTPGRFDEEIWLEMKRIWTLWADGYFCPSEAFPVTYEQTLE